MAMHALGTIKRSVVTAWHPDGYKVYYYVLPARTWDMVNTLMEAKYTDVRVNGRRVRVITSDHHLVFA